MHERPKYSNSVKPNLSRQNSIPKSQNNKTSIELKTVSQTDFSSMSESELILHQREMKKKQELDLDNLIEIAGKTKSQTIQIGDELSLHNNLLDRTQENVDRINDRLEITNKRLESFIHTVDKCESSCLLVIIIMLIVLILVTIFML
jgi:hypothetical protein